MVGEETGGNNVATTESISAAPVEPANVFGFAPETDAPDVAGRDQNAAAGNENTVVNQADDAPAFTDENQHKAFEAQRKRYQKEMDALRADPAMEVGEQLIRDVMRQDGCSREEAVGTIRQRFIDAYAKRENVGQDAARKLMQMQAADERKPAEQSPEDRAHEIVDELMNVQVPEGFDMDAAVNDPAFQELLVDYPAAAAVRIYQAEQRANQAPQQVADRLRARQIVPASTRPQQSVLPEPNFSEMSSEDFAKYKERAIKTLY